MTDFQEKTGFDNQGTISGNCAQRALIHALLLLGIPISQKTAHHRTRVSNFGALFSGTSVNQLMKGISRCNCLPFKHTMEDAKEVKEKIDKYLSAGMPVIISINNALHWMVLAGNASSEAYYWIDSDKRVLYGFDSWREIRRWMETGGEYHFIGLKPVDDRQLIHSLVPEFGKVYDLFDDDELAEYWGVYLEDLVDIFDCPKDDPDPILPYEFFTSYGEMIMDAVGQFHGLADARNIKWEFVNYKRVAEVHKLSLSRMNLHKGLVSMTAALTLEV